MIVALTVSWSVSSTVELKSLFSDFDKFNDADGDSLALSIFNSFDTSVRSFVVKLIRSSLI